jgi:hypothetical protein
MVFCESRVALKLNKKYKKNKPVFRKRLTGVLRAIIKVL